ncbi:MAG: cysteine desulfurase [Lachnospiraceae bacterium]|nr:cysteine desulfurase [Lachnospiraceae bacterium]
MEIYLDNSATTAVSPGVRAAMVEMLDAAYGNPSSLHRMGAEAEKRMRLAAKQVAAALGVSEKTIVFTSGGTEANNLAVIGGALARRRRGTHLITTQLEHPSVSAAMDRLEEQGFSVTRLPADGDGLVDPDALSAALREDTVLVSVMAVNNEIGSRQPLEELCRRTKAFSPEILFHTDAVQAFGKLPLRPRRMGIDLLSASGHKIHGPKGIGFLYVAEGVRLIPTVVGGGQQGGLRSGTENMPGIAGLGKAAEECAARTEEDRKALYARKELLQQLLGSLPGVRVNGPGEREKSAPHIVSATFEGIRSEVMLHALEDRGIYVSAGSACSSHKRGISPTLAAIGLSREAAGSTLRLSLSEDTTEEEIRATARTVADLLPLLRLYRRK